MEKLSIQYINNINNTVAEGLKDIDISNDIESFTQNYVNIYNILKFNLLLLLLLLLYLYIYLLKHF